MVESSHRGITIQYSEDTDQWVFELDGKIHRMATLKLARNYIDHPPVKRVKFDPIPVWYARYSEVKERELVRITSFDHEYAWISKVKSNHLSREKVSVGRLYLDTEENKKLLEEHDAREKEIRKLEKLNDKVLERVKTARDLAPKG